MPTHAEQRVLPHTPRQMFDLVADIERYPEFLPWCVAARITSREDNIVNADLVIGYKMFREPFSSRVTLVPPRESGPGAPAAGRVDVTYLTGPFRYLNNHWVFEPAGEGACRIDFYIDFEFHSHFLQKLMEAVFNEAVRRMVSAFESRARHVYGLATEAQVARPGPA